MAKSFLAGRLPLAVRGGYDFVDVRDMAVRLMARKEKGELGVRLCVMMPRLLRKERVSRRYIEHLDSLTEGERSQERPPSFPSGRKELRRAAFYAIY